ncbi:MAG: hypothetical protein Ta2B_18190 [Termitinemataceae bacterium]|nr:MAG: hypothetical protein Ta2B_18190 [Termitinemataceae bacterium]
MQILFSISLLGETRILTKVNRADTFTSEEYAKQYWYHSDHFGSASLITDYQGKEYERIEYTPYGELWVERKTPTDNLDTIFRFSGKELDVETGNYYYGARYLDPRTSRWLSTDPALGEYIPGAPINDEAKKRNGNLPGMGGVFNVVNFHLFAYAANNPVRYTDPDGRTFEIDENEGAVYKSQVEQYLNDIETSLINSGDAGALENFRNIRDDDTFFVKIRKPGKDNNGCNPENFKENGKTYQDAINFDPPSKTVPFYNSPTNPNEVIVPSRSQIIGHEIGHAIDEWNGTLDIIHQATGALGFSVLYDKLVEQSAIDFENKIVKGHYGHESPKFMMPYP